MNNDIIFSAIEDIKLFHLDYNKEIGDGVYSIPVDEDDEYDPVTLKIKFDSKSNKWYAVVRDKLYEIDISEDSTKIYVKEDSFNDLAESLALISYSDLAGARIVVVENKNTSEQKEIQSKSKSKKVDNKNTTKNKQVIDAGGPVDSVEKYFREFFKQNKPVANVPPEVIKFTEKFNGMLDELERIKDTIRNNPEYWM